MRDERSRFRRSPGAAPAFLPRAVGAVLALTLSAGCVEADRDSEARPGGDEQRAEAPDTTAGAARQANAPAPQYTLTRDQTHNRWSSAIPPVLRVPSGAVIAVETEEASDAQLRPGSTVEDLGDLSFDPIHPLTGPVYVEGADPGDVLAVTLHRIEVGDWGWAAVVPGFGFLADEFPEPWLRTWEIPAGAGSVEFAPGVRLPLAPFAGVMGVAPPTDSLLSTIPPRANGGNMDNRHLTEGTTVYFPVFVPGALFSIGDTHAVQGDGEISGTAIEAPMRIVYDVRVIEGGRRIAEPQYENDELYGVTAFGTTIDEAARKASRYMVDYLVEIHGLDRTDAYVLSSLAADLKISETVDVPHVLVSMHVPKSIFEDAAER
ncbi:MAG TPA: acetamidase/formamidase family protein [Gemmatimonadota bacterium]|jgi:acetamidase/formamidase